MSLKQVCLSMILCCATGLSAWGGETPPLVGHGLRLRLQPEQGRIQVEDRLQLPERLPESAELLLNRALKLEPVPGLTAQAARGSLRAYRIDPALAGKRLTLRYAGGLDGIAEKTRLGDMPRGMLSEKGVFLDGASGWYAWLPGSLQAFSLRVEAPDGWRVLSQGEGRRDGPVWRWREPHPQDDLYVLADRYQVYRRGDRPTTREVWLLEPDAPLAKRYLDASAKYLDFYSRLIDAYPYAKFAVVENRWQTGYGMPSFTLLGSRVMRLPFITHTSLPHEILHNWWGNGVYVDYRQGNWSEGLTAYLSDYLLRERKGDGAAYRRAALERFTNFAAQGRDFPLSRFVSRHGDRSQAVGYDKSLMLFHQIRRRLGDARFFQALRDFYRQWRFRKAAFDDLIAAFEQAADGSLADLVDPLLHGVGAPRLALQQVGLARHGDRWRLHLRIAQVQPGGHYRLSVPIRIDFARREPLWREVDLNGATAKLDLDLDERPLALSLDPEYQLFRLLDEGEKPSALGRLFGAPRQLLVLPAASADLPAWRALAARWARRYQNIEVKTDRELAALPMRGAVWVMGWDNRFAGAALRRVGKPAPDRDKIAVVWLDADNQAPPFAFIGAQGRAVIEALGRKLPHYAGYGELRFALPGVKIQRKKRLPARHSPLTRRFQSSEEEGR